MAKHMKEQVWKPYTAELVRTTTIGIMARNDDEANRIAELLACGATSYGCHIVNEAMCGGDDDVSRVYLGNEFTREDMNKEECIELLKVLED